MYIDKSIREYVKETASGEPIPGGGSVSALAASLGAALTSMVYNLTIDKKIYKELEEDQRSEMDANFEEIKKSIEKLNYFVDEDTKAFDDVMKAFKMPKETDEEKKKRTDAIQAGYKKALELPLECAKECKKVLELQETFANNGNVHAITDVGVGALLAYTGLEGSLLNVTINLKSIKDDAYRTQKEREVEEVLSTGKALKEKLMEKVYSRLK
ncbi:cyclodeaminase/cyclohydrolase family protein [Tissierella creatinophila]|uniref:Methenyltetrahydrofolate cyclohydrolase n=1 Tax=Tissierella creatinophila DSM 6911 TaxID=1123403 RepID=A0A1U7M5Z8_TISCR|nr:cyclodeaminase/cyclohydrolase family protein [Tissierella creatinophila]OLS02706.1 methenyltetrahydrofolate cyclohydrolase [Tissierella creatinophila DSM 6911]